MDEELKQHLTAMEERLNQRIDKIEASTQAVRTDMEATEHRTIEAMRNTKTELPRGFEPFSTVHTLRLRKVEANQSDLDASISGRVEILEKRLPADRTTARRSEVTA